MTHCEIPSANNGGIHKLGGSLEMGSMTRVDMPEDMQPGLDPLQFRPQMRAAQMNIAGSGEIQNAVRRCMGDQDIDSARDLLPAFDQFLVCGIIREAG